MGTPREFLHEKTSLRGILRFSQYFVAADHHGVCRQHGQRGFAFGCDAVHGLTSFFASRAHDVVLRGFAVVLCFITLKSRQNGRARVDHFNVGNPHAGENLPAARTFARKVQNGHGSNAVIGVIGKNRPGAIDLLGQQNSGKRVR